MIQTDGKSYNFETASLDAIINKIFDNPKVFYEAVAKELTKDEYKYLSNCLEERLTCQNCSKEGCTCLYHNQIIACHNWENNELIGKVKIMRNNKY